MRRSISKNLGLGASGPDRIDGKSTGNKALDKIVSEAAKDAYITFFKDTEMDENYCDAQYREFEVKLGIEPSYMYERLKIIVISKEKRLSYIETGYAWGAYGTGVRSTTRYYKDRKTKSKFVKFVDRWHEKLFTNTQQP